MNLFSKIVAGPLHRGIIVVLLILEKVKEIPLFPVEFMAQNKDLTPNKRIAHMKLILLVVNDDTRKNALIDVLTQNVPFHVFVASNSFAAVKFLGYFIPHLVIVDDSLPDMTGTQLYDYLHVNRMLETLRVIMVCEDLDDVREELEVRKLIGFSIPFDLEKFVATIEGIFSAYSSE